LKFPIEHRFTLTENFLEKYKTLSPKFGFDGLGEFVYMRTYSRIKDDGSNEEWWETVKRVVEGIYSIQKQHIFDYNLGWNQMKSQKSAQEMYDRIFSFKMLGSGRSLWAMGTNVIYEKGLSEALFNCSFISTEDLSDPGYLFANIMDFLMLGVGVGLDTRGAMSVEVKPQKDKVNLYIIPDTREGWVESLKLLINSFFGGLNYEFDYTEIRAEGEPIRTFGGVSSGYKPLKKLHEDVHKILLSNAGNPITARTIADIANFIGVCVVSGNVRRSAEIILGENEEEFLNLKNYLINPEREEFGWASNNSIFAKVGMDYSEIAKRICDNAEPGVIWIDNFRDHGRMGENGGKDFRIAGVNPCAEIGLESGELCNLVEIIPSNHESLDDFKKTIKYAYLFAKTVTLLNTSWTNSNRVMLRNRRIGIGLTGIVLFASKFGLNELREWMNDGYATLKYYDNIYSDWLAIPKSIKMTTVKPSGTLSLLAGVTPGVHFPQSNFYIRRIRLSKNSPFVKVLNKAGYKIEPAMEDPEKTVVVEFPVSLGKDIKTLSHVTIWEQLRMAEFSQKYWSDNGVSVTISFSENEKDDIVSILEHAQFTMKAISLLPKSTDGNNAYAQMPYEEISENKYLEISKNIKSLKFGKMSAVEGVGERYCETDVCELNNETDSILERR